MSGNKKPAGGQPASNGDNGAGGELSVHNYTTATALYQLLIQARERMQNDAPRRELHRRIYESLSQLAGGAE
jgi:hypothetical protein